MEREYYKEDPADSDAFEYMKVYTWIVSVLSCIIAGHEIQILDLDFKATEG